MLTLKVSCVSTLRRDDVIFETTALYYSNPHLRYALRSREIYTEGPITSPEILSEPPPPPRPRMTASTAYKRHRTANSHFRLVLSVTPCMHRISSIESDDPHTLGKDTGYIIMKVLPQQMGAMMCVAVLALPHLTPQLLKHGRHCHFQQVNFGGTLEYYCCIIHCTF